MVIKRLQRLTFKGKNPVIQHKEIKFITVKDTWILQNL